MPDISDATEQVTRKVGPLPLWGWALAVAGAVIGYRILSGRPALGGSSGSSGGTSINPSGEGFTAVDNSAIDTLTATVDAFIEGQASETAGLSERIESLGSANTLLQQLSDAINRRASALSTKDRNQRALADLTIKYKDKKISKAQYTKKSAEYNKIITEQTTIINSLNSLIADIKYKLANLGVSP
jgi:hypothetical protein